MNELNSLEEKFKFLESLGFKTPEHMLIKVDDIPRIYSYFIEKRQTLNYGIDGIVFSIDNVEKMKSLGVLSEKAKPKGMIALKFPAEAHLSRILGCKFSFKGSYDISIVANIEPVEIDGTIVKKASLKSYRWVKENDVGIGSVVEIIKGGDIIPKIEKVITTKMLSFTIPETCPYCGCMILEGEAQLYCENKNCHAKVAARISKFLKVLKVKGLGWKLLLKYVNSGVNLKDFISKDFNGIREKIELGSGISFVIWNKIRKQLEEFK